MPEGVVVSLVHKLLSSFFRHPMHFPSPQVFLEQDQPPIVSVVLHPIDHVKFS